MGVGSTFAGACVGAGAGAGEAAGAQAATVMASASNTGTTNDFFISLFSLFSSKVTETSRVSLFGLRCLGYIIKEVFCQYIISVLYNF
jgi:hypothetical protein